MKLITLKKLVDKAIENGHGHKMVFVDKETFKDARSEVGFFPAQGATMQVHGVCDDDGGIKLRKNGEECNRRAFTIYGYSKVFGKKVNP